MKSISGTILLLVLSSVVSQATAQQSNVGYYHKIADDGIHATYQLVWHAYIPGAEHEPSHPDEFHIPPSSGGGGSCDPNINECPIINGMFDPFLRGTTELPPVVVTVSRPTSRMWAIPYLSFQGGGGSGGGGCGSAGCGFRGIFPESEVEPCPVDGWQNIDDPVVERAFSTPATLMALKELANQSETLNIEKGGRLVVTTRPSGAFSVRFDPLENWAEIDEATCSHIDFTPNPGHQWQDGNYMVHTHPSACSPVVGPSPADRQQLRNLQFEGGIIIDTANNKIIYFKPNEPDNHLGHHEDLCGVD